MSETIDTPTLLRLATSSAQEELATALPGIVQAYDPLTQTADVLPAVQRWYEDPETGERVPENYPVIPLVPIAFPSGKGFAITFPLDKGDPVVLIFSAISMAEYLNTGAITVPADQRRHSANYPWAFPGGLPDTKKLGDASATDMHIGKRGGNVQIGITASEIHLGRDASDFVALASKVATELTAIQTSLGTCVPPPTSPYIPGSVAATIVKAK